MDQIYPDQGLVTFLNRMVIPSLRFHLFTNNVTPNRGTVLADLTQAVWSGYSAITVFAASFTLSSVAGHVGSLLAAPIAFTNSSGGSQSAYGYYITDAADTVLMGVARFDSAPVAKNDGDSWVVMPIIGDVSVLSS